jgi:tetratricopeptide (TPR) repeat protein
MYALTALFITFLAVGGVLNISALLGKLSVLLAIIAALVLALALQTLVLSPELGLLMVQGRLHFLMLKMVLLLVVVGAGLGWCAAIQNLFPGTSRWIFFLGLCVVGLEISWSINLIEYKAGKLNDDSYIYACAYQSASLYIWLAGWLAPFVTAISLVRSSFHRGVILKASLLFAVIVSIIVTVRDLFFTVYVSPWVMLCVLMILLSSLFEATAETPLSRVVSLCAHFPDFLRQVTSLSHKTLSWLHYSLIAVTDFSVKSIASLLLVVLVGLTAAIALTPIADARKTVVLPFKTTAMMKKDIGESFADRLVYTMRELNEELQQKFVSYLFVPPNTAKSLPKPVLIATTQEDQVVTALAKSPGIKVGEYLEIPLDVAVSAIQSPIRWLIGATEIRGEMFREGTHHITILANSSKGDTWRQYSDVLDSTGDGLDVLAEELAFRVLSRDPIYASQMPHSWEAFQRYRKGLQAWKRFEDVLDFDSLAQAITEFHGAIQKDPRFVAGYYRLGLAYYQNGQPDRAVDAFSASLEVDTQYYSSALSLANMILSPDTFPGYESLTKVPLSKGPFADRQEYLKPHAYNLFMKVAVAPREKVSQEDRAAAYIGLCVTPQANIGAKERLHIAYYFCRRAETILSTIPLGAHAVGDPSSFTPRDLLNMMPFLLGSIMEESEQPQWSRAEKPTTWHCKDGQNLVPIRNPVLGYERIRKVAVGPHAVVAKKYYEQLSRLWPDEAITRCLLASVDYALLRDKSMDEFELDPQAHLYAASEFVSEKTGDGAQDDDKRRGSYSLKLKELETAIIKGVYSYKTLVDYGYTYYLWVFNMIETGRPLGLEPLHKTGEQAFRYTKTAVGLAADVQGLKDEADARSTLGALFLAAAEFGEAYDELQRAWLIGPKNHAFDSLRWNLMQACFCSSKENDTQHRLGMYGVLAALLKEHNEMLGFDRITKPFLGGKRYFPDRKNFARRSNTAMVRSRNVEDSDIAKIIFWPIDKAKYKMEGYRNTETEDEYSVYLSEDDRTWLNLGPFTYSIRSQAFPWLEKKLSSLKDGERADLEIPPDHQNYITETRWYDAFSYQMGSQEIPWLETAVADMHIDDVRLVKALPSPQTFYEDEDDTVEKDFSVEKSDVPPDITIGMVLTDGKKVATVLPSVGGDRITLTQRHPLEVARKEPLFLIKLVDIETVH